MIDLVLSLTIGLFQADEEDLVPVRPAELAVGHWVEIKGELGPGDLFTASEVLLTEPDRYESLLGTVSSHSVADGELVLLGQRVTLTEKTDWSDIEPQDLTGQRVKISGRYRGPGKFSARDVRRRDPGRDRIVGRLDGVETRDGVLELELMRFSVVLEPEAELASEQPVGALPRIPRRWNPPQIEGRINEDDLLRESVEIFPWLRFGGQLEFDTDSEEEFDLDPDDDEDRKDTEIAARLRLAWRLGDDVFARTEARLRSRWRDDDEDGSSDETEVRLGETWVYWRDGFGEGVDLQVGRQDFDDEREWIYDQNLDGLRLVSTGQATRTELSLSTTLGAAGRRDEGTLNLGGYFSNLDDDKHLAAWFFHRDYERSADGRMTHFGARAIGEWLDPLEVWLDVGAVAGVEDGRDVFGWGADVGGYWRPNDSPFSLIAGYAYGSGDDGSGDDGAFRQTGLQDNNGRFGTVTSIRYYGELLDPELSNLTVFTAGLSWWFQERSTLSVIYHDYAQAEAANFLRDTELDANPTGLDTDLGSEIDLVLGSRAFPSFDIELIGGMFFPGDAFVSDEEATFVKLQLRYRF